MSRVLKLAEQLFREEHPGPHWTIPWGHRPELSNLWTSLQKKYIERAEAELLRGDIHQSSSTKEK